MPIETATVARAIQTWLAGEVGRAIWANQKAPQPAFPYGTVQVLGVRRVGPRDAVRRTVDPTRVPPNDVVEERFGPREVVVSVNVYSRQPTADAPYDWDSGALALSSRALSSLSRSDVVSTLRAAGLGVSTMSEVRDLDFLSDDSWVERRQFDVTFLTGSSDAGALYAATVGKIEVIEMAVTLDGRRTEFEAGLLGPQLLENESAEDAAPFDTFTHWGPTFGGADPAATATRVADATAPHGDWVCEAGYNTDVGTAGQVRVGHGHRDASYVPVVPGRTYRVAAWFRNVSPAASIAVGGLVSSYPGPSQDSTASFPLSPFVAAADWVRREWEFTAPVDAHHVSLFFEAFTQAGHTGPLYRTDAWSLREVL